MVLAKLKAAGGMTDVEVKQLKDKSVKTVLKVKGINPDLHKQFVMSLSACLNWVRKCEPPSLWLSTQWEIMFALNSSMNP